MCRRYLETLADVQHQKPGLKYDLYTLWLFTFSDLKTVIYPQLAFGLCNALSGLLTTNPNPTVLGILARLPQVLAWIWLNLLLEVVDNQRLPQSVLEDAINKPWRPLPAQRVTADGARRLLLLSVPVVLVVSFCLGSIKSSVALMIASWLYNDLGGSDENYIIRNLLNACGLTFIGAGATTIAAGGYELNERGYGWLGVLACTIFSTIQTQDLADIEGDAARGRKTLPLVHGQRIARWSIFLSVTAWSLVCPTFWRLHPYAYIPSTLAGGLLASRILLMRTVAADEATWKIWCLWMMVLYFLPLFKDHSVLETLWKGCGQVGQ